MNKMFFLITSILAVSNISILAEKITDPAQLAAIKEATNGNSFQSQAAILTFIDLATKIPVEGPWITIDDNGRLRELNPLDRTLGDTISPQTLSAIIHKMRQNPQSLIGRYFKEAKPGCLNRITDRVQKSVIDSFPEEADKIQSALFNFQGKANPKIGELLFPKYEWTAALIIENGVIYSANSYSGKKLFKLTKQQIISIILKDMIDEQGELHLPFDGNIEKVLWGPKEELAKAANLKSLSLSTMRAHMVQDFYRNNNSEWESAQNILDF